MAGLRACRSRYWNPPPAGKDELPGAAFTEGNSIPTPTPAVSRAPIHTHAIVLSLNNKLLKSFMKVYLEAQVPAQIAPEIDLKPCEQTLKARFPNLYYNNLHMDCYWFCQQCKDHFKTSGAKRLNRIPFAVLFLRWLVT